MHRLSLQQLNAVSGGSDDEIFGPTEPLDTSVADETSESTEQEFGSIDAATAYELGSQPTEAQYETPAEDRSVTAASGDDELRHAVDDYFRMPSHERLDQQMRFASEQYDRDLARAFDSIETRDRVNYDRSNPSAIALADDYLASEPRVSSYDAEGARYQAQQLEYGMARAEWWGRGGPMPWNGPPPSYDDPSLSQQASGLNRVARMLQRAGAR